MFFNVSTYEALPEFIGMTPTLATAVRGQTGFLPGYEECLIIYKIVHL